MLKLLIDPREKGFHVKRGKCVRAFRVGQCPVKYGRATSAPPFSPRLSEPAGRHRAHKYGSGTVSRAPRPDAGKDWNVPAQVLAKKALSTFDRSVHLVSGQIDEAEG